MDRDPDAQCSAYRRLFRCKLRDRELDVIRAATNKAWVLADDRFRAKVEALLDRRVTPRPRGGDRRSRDYRESINRD